MKEIQFAAGYRLMIRIDAIQSILLKEKVIEINLGVAGKYEYKYSTPYDAEKAYKDIIELINA